jgi:EAL domain-containing protein (putative c-di-GMP-specific phosphodiesterase class I)
VTGGAVVEYLRDLGVDYAQGNWISPPRPLFDRGVSALSR